MSVLLSVSWECNFGKETDNELGRRVRRCNLKGTGGYREFSGMVYYRIRCGLRGKQAEDLPLSLTIKR